MTGWQTSEVRQHMTDPRAPSVLKPGRARRRRLLGMSLIAALALFAVAFALGGASAARASPAKAAAPAVRAATPALAMAPAGH
jgi:hypothetical protein